MDEAGPEKVVICMPFVQLAMLNERSVSIEVKVGGGCGADSFLGP